MHKKERMLVLCQAYPTISSKYELLICMAGITEEGAMRRIYPVPFINWQKDPISKRNWIEYEIKDDHSSDGRKESRKIVPSTLSVGEKVGHEELRELILNNLSNLEELREEGNSLGMIKPTVTDLDFEWKEARQKKSDIISKQRTLDGDRINFYYPPYLIKYRFSCSGSDDCPGHHIMCEDWEAISLYRKMCTRSPSVEIAHEKVKKNLFEWMSKERALYFMMGTDARFGKWLIISLLYPRLPSPKSGHLMTLDDY